ncbi:MAG TPA: hypothetical protein VK846_17360 [Candidatus Limnocylindria bacterium]|nr:hypothetical protein [Candidatus Limnocylindria bacterium]
MRFLVALSAILFFAAPSFARLGVVRTINGQTFEGHIRFTPERVIIVNAARGSVSGVQLTNIARISFPTNSLAGALDDFGDESLPEPWREADIGAMLIPGSTRHEGGIFSVRSSGVNIDGEADSFHYVFKPVRGDSEIVAEVVSIQYTHFNAKAGLMMRETLNEYSPNVMIALTAQRGAALQIRSGERARTEAASLRGVFAPHWLKLRRRGNEFSAFTSLNGRIWSLLDKVSVSMSETFYVGLAVASARDAVLNWTTFAKVREAPKLVNENFTPEVELVSGSVVTGRPDRANENEVLFSGLPKAFRVPTERVARITYQPLSGAMAWKTRVSRSGAWVSSGDFFDGDFKSIEGRKLTISSVLYGLRTFDIDDEVLAVVLQPRKARHAVFELETPDGATLYLSDLALGDGELRVQESAMGEVRVPAFEILELRRR